MITKLLDVEFEDRLFLVRCGDYIGFVFANEPYELYWQIDQYFDPYEVELARISSADIDRVGFVVVTKILESSSDGQGPELGFVSETIYDVSNDAHWFTPNWLDLDPLDPEEL